MADRDITNITVAFPQWVVDRLDFYRDTLTLTRGAAVRYLVVTHPLFAGRAAPTAAVLTQPQPPGWPEKAVPIETQPDKALPG